MDCLVKNYALKRQKEIILSLFIYYNRVRYSTDFKINIYVIISENKRNIRISLWLFFYFVRYTMINLIAIENIAAA